MSKFPEHQFTPYPALKRLRRLRRDKRITFAQWAIGHTLLFTCRQPGCSEVMISQDALAREVGCDPSTVVRGLKVLADLRVLAWRKTRVFVKWAGGVASRQGRNVYTFPPTPATDMDFAGTSTMKERKKGSLARKPAAEGPSEGSDEWARWNRDRQLAMLGSPPLR